MLIGQVLLHIDHLMNYLMMLYLVWYSSLISSVIYCLGGWHVCVLILLKGILFARNSRLVSDKLELGWRYPCDGPGRGGTCQVSSYDHLYVALFWMYNSISIVVFHFYWKLQSDVFGSISVTNDIQHLCSSDFYFNATSVNGWLRCLLWTQASQVIQSYGSSLCGYGLIFICAHFIWAFSLMFLFSGCGYWQELIEPISLV